MIASELSIIFMRFLFEDFLKSVTDSDVVRIVLSSILLRWQRNISVLGTSDTDNR